MNVFRSRTSACILFLCIASCPALFGQDALIDSFSVQPGENTAPADTGSPSDSPDKTVEPHDQQPVASLIPEPPAPPEPASLLYFFPDPVPETSVLMLLDPPATPPAVATPSSPPTSATKTAPPAPPTSTAPASTTSDAPASTTSVVPPLSAGNTGSTSVQDSDSATAEQSKPSASEPVPGIWSVEPSLPSRKTEPVPPASLGRSAALSVGQYLEILYPGSGWVFLGDALGQNSLVYQSRKLDGPDTVFLFRAGKAGSAVLQFSRYDVLQDSYSRDTLAVSVAKSERPVSGKIRAPDYFSAGSSAPAPSASETPAGSTGRALAAPGFSGISDEPELVTGSSIVSSPAEDPLVLLEKTRDALSAGDQEGALRELDRFFAVSVENLDEGWFLRGKAYEANGKARDIKKALDSYTTLMAAYPGSSFWKDAEARVRYINRLYLQIR